MDARTNALFERAVIMGTLARHEAAKSGGLPSYISPTDGTRLVAAQITATATIFAALVEADMVAQLRQSQATEN
ncbi:hypothetical protein [Methylorubrum suomiense]|uniref:Uncharacterized protein n=1 Tax=Methylorubrum suomiense TaxID=144191 RepID=A0ABQ4V238_9HYPH|nr:hypothetical protein [Methylorubrum suomiense]GJE78130.1 hypothetical protein BGCPKDLD_4741 [Methylorubrum suomiense]